MKVVSFAAPRPASDLPTIQGLVARAQATASYILGDQVLEFEERVRAITRAGHAVATGSGADGLELALEALELREGDEVVVPAWTFAAVANAVIRTGGRPRFVDVDGRSGLMDLAQIPAVTGPRTRAILAVHHFQAMIDMPRILEIARQRGVPVIENAAAMFGGSVAGLPAGRHGDFGVFSFHPVKPLGGIANAGVVITDSEWHARRCRMLRNHGQGEVRSLHQHVGFNHRMDEIAAGYLLQRLDDMRDVLAARSSAARRYLKALEGVADAVRPLVSDSGQPVHYLFVIEVAQREGLRAALTAAGVETRVHYPAPIPHQPAFSHLEYRAGDFPVAARLSTRCLTLPLHPAMTADDIDYVVEVIEGFYGR